MDIELKIINLFVIKPKRPRLIGLLQANKRDQVIPYFNDPCIFDKRNISEFKGSERSLDNLVHQYSKMGMRDEIFLLSSNGEWDAKIYDLTSILDQCLMSSSDTIGYCSKSDTAFYEWHHSGVSYFLKCK